MAKVICLLKMFWKKSIDFSRNNIESDRGIKMYKREKGARSVIRKIILLGMAGALLATGGCSQTKGTGSESGVDKGSSVVLENEDKNSENDNQNETQVALSEEDLAAPIEYSFQKHPCSLVDGETELAISNYTTIELDKSEREKFVKLKDILDDFGKNGEKEVDTFFESSADEIREMFNNGIGIGYEADKFFAPVRADGRVFSFIITNYTFLAGAHGFTDYSNYNYDPVTGEEIKFSDVVKDTDKLPDIIVDELEKQNEDLVEYFENGPEDKENLRAGIPDRLSNNAAALSWVLDYDGVWFYFEDYAMGTYVAGSRNVKVKFADYPDLFTDTYNNYTDGNLPQIKDVAKELKDAENRITDASSIGSVKLNAGTGNGESDYGYDSVNPETVSVSREEYKYLKDILLICYTT